MRSVQFHHQEIKRTRFLNMSELKHDALRIYRNSVANLQNIFFIPNIFAKKLTQSIKSVKSVESVESASKSQPHSSIGRYARNLLKIKVYN